LLELLLVFVLLVLLVAMIGAPLRSGRAASREAAASADRAQLEAAKEAKYREIRDAELDYQTGKLSESDWRALDRSLRAEAVELLKRLDAVDGR
jgi:type II secretory pathway pseudopilin PulG